MQTEKWALLALIVVLVSGAASAAPSNSSNVVLQVTDYSIIPPVVYPGVVGYAKLTVADTGSDAATGVSVYYTYSRSSAQLFFSAGDISGGSSAQITIPFKIPQEVPNGIYLIGVNIYYTPSSTSQQKMTSISIPVIVSQYEVLEVTTVGTDRTVIAPGEAVQLQLGINNTGGVVNNLLVTTPQNSSFFLQGTTQKSLGNIPSGSGINITLGLLSSSSAQLGQYTIPLVFTYQDATGNTTSETLYVGPVSILGPSTQFRLSMNPLTPTEVGSQATFQLTIENRGTGPLTAIVDANSTTAFTPLGISRIYFESVGPGQNVSKNLTLGISNSISAGYYELPLTVTLSSGNVVTQNLGVPVSATPDLTVTASSQFSAGGGETVALEISNTGNAPIRSVYVSASSKDYTIAGASDKFVGTLNVDDFTTMSLTVLARGGTGNHTITVTTSFKDSNNIPHVVTKTVDVGAFTGNGNFTSATFGNRRSQGIIFGLSWEEIIGGVVVIVIAYFAYKRFIKRGAKK
jgi:hypothetical protein